MLSTGVIEKFTRKRTLELFRVGCDSTNFQILKLLPKKISDLEEELKLSTMPVNRRVNALVRLGLARRILGTGNVLPTELTKRFIDLVEGIVKEVEEVVPLFLELA